MAFGRWTNWLRRLRQPVGGREADTVFRFLLALAIFLWGFPFLMELPHTLNHVWGSENRVNALRNSCRSDLRQIGLALEMYCQDNDGHLWPRQPTPRPLPIVLAPYVKNPQVLICPADRTLEPARGSILYTSYEVNDSLLALLLERAQGQPFAWDRQPWHSGGRNVLTLGSRPRWMREKDLDALFIRP